MDQKGYVNSLIMVLFVMAMALIIIGIKHYLNQ
ncbi:MAG: hypothetical protein A4E53_00334 [Pelotomaculum sp. PtaB.Bin104]|nr:MAG: hypothetical protein A4E53_00334 [Pelotomaculum sp. PtaB.Bin104]